MKSFFTFRSLIVTLTLFILGTIKLLPIIGSYFAYFSTHAIVFPVAGFIGGPLSAIAYLGLKIVLCKLTLHKALYYQLFNNLGGIAANISWHNNKIINILVLSLCTLFFILHPIGSQVPLYTLYWLIPFFLIITNQRSLFYRSFAATWMSHAVGSVVWLYTRTVTLAEWTFLTLNPLVVGERIIFALGIMVCIHAIWIIQYYVSFYAKQLFAKRKAHA